MKTRAEPTQEAPLHVEPALASATHTAPARPGAKDGANAAQARAQELRAIEEWMADPPGPVRQPKQTDDEILREARAMFLPNSPTKAGASRALSRREDVAPTVRTSKTAASAPRKRGARPGPRSNRSQVLEKARAMIEAFTCIGLIEGRMVPVPTEDGRSYMVRMQVNESETIAAVLVDTLIAASPQRGACWVDPSGNLVPFEEPISAGFSVPATTTRTGAINDLLARWEKRAATAGVKIWQLSTADMLLDGLRAVGIRKSEAHNLIRGLPRSGEASWKRLDHFARFVNECCELDPSARILHAELYGAYETWYAALSFDDESLELARVTLTKELDSSVSEEDRRSAYERYWKVQGPAWGAKKFSAKTFSEEICLCGKAFGCRGVEAETFYVGGKHVRGYSGICLRKP